MGLLVLKLGLALREAHSLFLTACDLGLDCLETHFRDVIPDQGLPLLLRAMLDRLQRLLGLRSESPLTVLAGDDRVDLIDAGLLELVECHA